MSGLPFWIRMHLIPDPSCGVVPKRVLIRPSHPVKESDVANCHRASVFLCRLPSDDLYCEREFKRVHGRH